MEQALEHGAAARATRTRGVDQLSGGQKQRVALARAVVLEPEVLLLDEPMAALDLKLRKEMQVEVKNLQERLGITFVFVTHDQDEALVHERPHRGDEPGAHRAGRPPRGSTSGRARASWPTSWPCGTCSRPRWGGASGGTARLRTDPGWHVRGATDDGGYAVGARVVVGVRPERISAGEGGRERAERRSSTTRSTWATAPTGACASGTRPLTVAEGAATAQPPQARRPMTISFPPDAVLRLATAPEAARAAVTPRRHAQAAALSWPLALVVPVRAAAGPHVRGVARPALRLRRRRLGAASRELRARAEPLYLAIFARSLGLAARDDGRLPAGRVPGGVLARRSRRTRRRRSALLVLVVLPFWTSFLVRMYAWVFLLRSEGLVNLTLAALGLPPLDCSTTTSRC